MLDLITGTPGAGKTLLAVHELYQAQQAGRLCFARIDGLTMPGVQPLVGSWRDCPDGSLIVVDEAQELFGSGERARVSDDDIYDLERHRHKGLDLILITQDPRLLASHVLHLVGRHRHLVRVMGSKQVRMYTMDTCSERMAKSDLRAALMVVWRHPVYVYGHYRSATIHTRRSRPPVLIWVALAGALGMAAFSVYGLQRFFVGGIADAAAVSAAADAAVHRGPGPLPTGRPGHPDTARVDAQRELHDSVQGCVVVGERCRCWGRDHQTVALTQAQCVRTARSPIRTTAAAESIAAYQSRGRRSGDERQRGTAPPSLSNPGIEQLPKFVGQDRK